VTTVPSRRERLRTATLGEIKSAARKLLDQGPGAISLRAIARDMGMTAPALYRYYPNLEELVSELCADLYNEMSDALEQARDTCPVDDPGTRLYAVAREFRRWSVAHRAEFGLMFGSPLPGLGAQEDDMSGKAGGGMRFANVFLGLFIQIWRRTPFDVPAEAELPPRLVDQLSRYMSAIGTELPLGAVQLFLSCWIRLYGLVAMEVFGHLHFALEDVEPMFEAELASAARLLGVPPQAPGARQSTGPSPDRRPLSVKEIREVDAERERLADDEQ
jgi:AcrR family transcriptional regulator